jgi:hypothetical protein
MSRQFGKDEQKWCDFGVGTRALYLAAGTAICQQEAPKMTNDE